jgi:hypothetical protein
MSDYQIKLVVKTYFDTLINMGISEKSVKDFNQKNGVLHIELENGEIIKKEIRNYD